MRNGSNPEVLRDILGVAFIHRLPGDIITMIRTAR